jgi:hypothetical protein
MLATSRPDDQRPIDDAEEEAFQLSHFSSAEGGALVDVRGCRLRHLRGCRRNRGRVFTEQRELARCASDRTPIQIIRYVIQPTERHFLRLSRTELAHERR